MKHKRFNEVKPYTYCILRKSDGMRYHGVRIHNVKLELSPIFQSKCVIDKIHQKRKDMYMRLAKMSSEEFDIYLKSISQHSAVQSQKITQRNKGIFMLKNKEKSISQVVDSKEVTC